jgi:hypothetical protein
MILELKDQAMQCSVLDSLGAPYPMLRGTIRDNTAHRRLAI